MFGVKISDRVHEREGSAWVDRIYPNHSNHIWATGSGWNKGWRISGTFYDCASASGAIPQIYYLRTEFGEARAREFLDKYHSQLSIDQDSLVKFLRTEFNTLFATNVDRTNAP